MKPAVRSRARVNQRETTTPQWLVFTIIVALTSMICLTINFRAFGELNEEIQHNQSLGAEVDRLTNENLAIQEEIHGLKTDPRMIEREAQKLGLGRANEKILVTSN